MTTNRTCQSPEEQCSRPVTARGLCRMHYLREYRAGNHTARPTRANGIRKQCPPDHPHDVDTCWTRHGCRCSTCVHERAMERQRRRNRLRAYGRDDQIGPRLVPAAPVRAHVQQLHELGLGYERIGRAAGVGHGPMMDLIYGPRGTDQRAPVEEIRKSYADALLALTADSVEAALVDPTGTVRRLRALVAIGWQETALAEALGMGVGNFWTLLHGRRNRITTGTRNKVTALFIQQWDKPQDGVRAERAKKIAKHYRWVGPLAWDDIDDPTEVPEGVAKARDARYTATEYLDDIAFLLELGESPAPGRRHRRPHRAGHRQSSRAASPRRHPDRLRADAAEAGRSMSLVTHLSPRRRRVVLDLGDPAEAASVCAALRELGLTGHIHLEVVDEILGGGSEEIVDEIRDRLHLRAHLEEVPDE